MHRIEGGPYRFGRIGLITVTDREHGVEQSFADEIAVPGGDGVLHSLAISDRPLPGSRHLAGVVETDHHRNGEITGDVEPLEDLDADIEVRCPFLDRVEMGEVGEIAEMNLLEADPDTNETFGMASVGIGTLMRRANVVLLREIIDQQLADETNHPRIGSIRTVGRDSCRDRIGGLGRRQGCSAVVEASRTEPTVELNSSISIGNMDTDGISIGIETQQEKVHRSTATETVLHRLAKVMKALKTCTGGKGIIAAMGSATLMLRIQ